MLFIESKPNPTDKYFAELELLKIDMASEFREPAESQTLVWMQHFDDEDGFVNETTRVTVRKGYIVAYRRLMTTADFNPREE